MIIQVKITSEELNCNVIEWDDPDNIRVTIFDPEGSGGTDKFDFKRPDEAPQFYPDEEMERLGKMLVESEERVVKIVSFIGASSERVKQIAQP